MYLELQLVIKIFTSLLVLVLSALQRQQREADFVQVWA